MQRFMAPSASPKRIATPTGLPRIRGRHHATRMTAAKASRPNAVPAGPRSSNTSTANAAPTCREVTASRTSPTARAEPSTMGSGGWDGVRVEGLAVPQLSQRRPVPHPLAHAAVGLPAGRLVDPAGALVALLGPQRRLGAAGLAEGRLAGAQEQPADAPAPRARMRVEE